MINRNVNMSWIGNISTVGTNRFIMVKGEIWKMSQAQTSFTFHHSLISNDSFKDVFDLSDDKLDKLIQTYYPRFKPGINLFWGVWLGPIIRPGVFDGIAPLEIKKVSVTRDGIFRVELDIPEKEMAIKVQPQCSVWFDFSKKAVTKVEGDVFDLNVKDIHGESIREKYNED
jgi:hypothetical protein